MIAKYSKRVTLGLVVVSVLWLMFGCASKGTYTYANAKYGDEGEMAEYTHISVTSPDNPVTPAKFKGNPEGKHKINTGNQQALDYVMQGITDKTTWIGILLIIAGLVIAAGSFYFSRFSLYKGLVIGGATSAVGVALIWLPVIIDRYTGYILAGILIFGVALFSDEIAQWWSGEEE